MRRPYGIVITVILTGLLHWVLPGGPGPNRPPAERRLEFTYQTDLREIPAGAKHVDLWIPYPTSDENQTISDVRIESPFPSKLTKDPEYGNSILYVGVDNPSSSPGTVRMTFNVTRKENFRKNLAGRSGAEPDPLLSRYRKPDALVPIDGKIKAMAEEVTAGKKTPLEKARAIYDYTVSTLKYDKSGTGWGRGDIYYACDIKRGNCSDFHAVFIGFCRAVDIPARFEIGFPLPDTRGRGEIAGYHCWSQFYLDGKGWIPVDCSEASKNPSKTEYFFGAHDENRVLFTKGRDIQLEPRQKGKPLNFFIYPYAEVDGQPFDKIGRKFMFADLK